MSESKPNLTVGAKLKLFALIPILIFRAIKYILATLLSRRPSRPLARTLTVAFTRASMTTIIPITSQYASPTPSTGAAIRDYCAAKNIPLRSTPIPIPTSNHAVPPATLHILTPTPPPTTDSTRTPGPSLLLYLHGGGYTAPLFAAAHLPFALRLATACRARAVAVLEYGLAPALRHPGQLIQAAAALQHLLSPTGAGYAPADVVLAGDSAGGNLAAALLAHVRAARPGAEPLAVAGRLRAAVLVSPWAGMRFEGGSYGRNARWDGVTVEAMVAAREAWGPSREVWADLVGGEAPGGGGVEGFWEGVFRGEGRVVERAIVTVGEEEIMLDDIVAWAGMIGASEKGEGGELGDEGGKSSDVLLVRSPGEGHTGAVVDSTAGVNVKGSMLSTIVEWLEGL
ncbi:hypothetical protein GTA08_BOTSDO09050 [Neofusicoccum parvum]|nr:hypothetical protein GTA08_BOTSDO09050 [Neofusicoccum parvum]